MFAVAVATVGRRGHKGRQAIPFLGGQGLKRALILGVHEPVDPAGNHGAQHKHRKDQVYAPVTRTGLAAPGDAIALTSASLLFSFHSRFGHRTRRSTSHLGVWQLTEWHAIGMRLAKGNRAIVTCAIPSAIPPVPTGTTNGGSLPAPIIFRFRPHPGSVGKTG